MTYPRFLPTESASGVLQLRFGRRDKSSRILLSETTPRWMEKVNNRLNALCALPRGWDGYRSGPVNFTTASFALRLLERCCGMDVDAPDIVPGPSGDLQIEWHNVKGDIEIHVRRPNLVEAWRSNPSFGDDGEEITLTNKFDELEVWIQGLLGANVAAAA